MSSNYLPSAGSFPRFDMGFELPKTLLGGEHYNAGLP
jgi:hypothetical protein